MGREMGRAVDSFFSPFNLGWIIWSVFTAFHILGLGPFLQRLEKTADIIHRLPGVLLGDRPSGSALEYRDGLLNQFRAVLRHCSTPNKRPRRGRPDRAPAGSVSALRRKFKTPVIGPACLCFQTLGATTGVAKLRST